MEQNLGGISAFKDLPARIRIGNAFFYLVREDGAFWLFSSLCPHAGGEVEWLPEGEEFACPLHGWRFDTRGECVDMEGAGLQRYPVKERDGHLVVVL